ncbi:MAG: acyl-CoA thioesterase [Rhodopseudomonas sp.]|nr:acyl-CoA thioesterase [Rhodopseudomonas sp.]
MNDQTAPRPRKPMPRLADYPHRVRDVVRFGDLDAQGHVNNAVFATYFESGRVALFRDRDLGIGVANATYVLVRQEIDFLNELHWPGDVEIGTALADVGRSSFVMTQAIFNGDVCVAANRATLVMLDTVTRRSRPLTPEALARLEPWRYRGGEPAR